VPRWRPSSTPIMRCCSPRLWGAGTTSSSDGQYFRAGRRGGGHGSINAKYGTDPGVLFYTHVSDQYGPFPSKVISATTGEAPHVLDGLLHHGTTLELKEHYTDTGGANDHVFGLCHLLGYRFAPRLRDIRDRRLGTIEPGSEYKGLEPLLGHPIRVDLIRECWDDVVRLAASIKAGTVAPSVMLKKLSGYKRQNRLHLALQEIGRIERTLFTMDWLESPELRRRCQAGLNKGEARHFLAHAIYVHRQGRITDRTFENQSYRASGLNLVIAAIVYWNTVYAPENDGCRRPGPSACPHLTVGLVAHQPDRRLPVGAGRDRRRRLPAAQHVEKPAEIGRMTACSIFVRVSVV
jgi:TnpA family transposase